MPPRLLIAEPEDFAPAALARLRAVFDVACRRLAQAELRGALAEYDAVWIRLGLRVAAADLPARPRCRFLLTATTGTDHLDLAALADRGVRVLSLRGESAFLETIAATAEHTVALALALVRRLVPAAAAARAGTWDRQAYRGHELRGRTALVIGYGRLGRKVARVFQALDMSVLAVDPAVTVADPGIEQVAGLDDALPRADLVTLHVPLGEATRGLLGAERLARMKPGAWLINTSRGAVLDEAALLDALAAGRLAGAALDVVSGEPDVGPAHPLVRYAAAHPHLLLTPHIGGATWESMARCEEFLAGRLLEQWTA